MIEYREDPNLMSTEHLHAEQTERLKQLEYWIEYKKNLCRGDDAHKVAQREIQWFQQRLKRIKQVLVIRYTEN